MAEYKEFLSSINKIGAMHYFSYPVWWPH